MPGVVELRVVNPDGVGPDGSEDIIFCYSLQFVTESPPLT